MLRFLILLLYNFLYVPALLFMAPAALRKMKARGGRVSDLKQRFGFYDSGKKACLAALRTRGRVWWIHAVSVGEVGVAAKLIRELMRRDETLGIVLSTTTPTGFAEAGKIASEFSSRLVTIYNPLDLWFVVRRCLHLIAPQRLVLVEAEVWPNLLFAARGRGIAVSLVNARLSPRSERRYGHALPMVRPFFAMLTQCFVQEPEDIARWERLGAVRGRIACVGSIKYDTAGQSEPHLEAAAFGKALQQMGWQPGQPVLLAASTHPGEELEIARVYSELKSQVAGLHLIIVPRHAERAAAVARELHDLGLTMARRSELTAVAHAECLLVDTTGELRAWQHCATAVVVGKSFLGKGGQNPAEAITAGRAVLFGPHMENFEPLVRQLLAAQGAVQVRDFGELRTRLLELFKNDDSRARLAENGRLALRTHEGATARTADLLGCAAA